MLSLSRIKKGDAPIPTGSPSAPCGQGEREHHKEHHSTVYNISCVVYELYRLRAETASPNGSIARGAASMQHYNYSTNHGSAACWSCLLHQSAGSLVGPQYRLCAGCLCALSHHLCDCRNNHLDSFVVALGVWLPVYHSETNSTVLRWLHHRCRY